MDIFLCNLFDAEKVKSPVDALNFPNPTGKTLPKGVPNNQTTSVLDVNTLLSR